MADKGSRKKDSGPEHDISDDPTESGSGKSGRRKPAHKNSKSANNTENKSEKKSADSVKDREGDRSPTRNVRSAISASAVSKNPDVSNNKQDKMATGGNAGAERGTVSKDTKDSETKSLDRLASLMENQTALMMKMFEKISNETESPGGEKKRGVDHGNDGDDNDDDVDFRSTYDVDMEQDYDGNPSIRESKKDSNLRDQWQDYLKGDGSSSEEEGQADQSNDSDFFKDLDELFKAQDKCGPDIDDKLANIVNAGIRSGLSEESLKKLLDDYFRPGNCSNLMVPKVNNEIWNKLKLETRLQDARFQKTQNLVIKAMIPLIMSMNNLHKLKSSSKSGVAKEVRGVRDLLKDSFSMFTAVFSDLVLRRKELIKVDVNPQYKQLCAPSVPHTDWLFGDDLSKAIKDINDASQLGKVVGRPRGGGRGFQRNHPYNSSYKRGNSGRGSRPFLRGRGQGRSQQGRQQTWQSKKD